MVHTVLAVEIGAWARDGSLGFPCLFGESWTFIRHCLTKNLAILYALIFWPFLFFSTCQTVPACTFNLNSEYKRKHVGFFFFLRLCVLA